MDLLHRPKPAVGTSLPEILCLLACLSIGLAQSLPLWGSAGAGLALGQARAAFETDWRGARWQAQTRGHAMRLQAIVPCVRPNLPGGWHCGWQWVQEDTGQLIQESRLPPGLSVSVKPNSPWRIDAWGEPLSGGASILFQSTVGSATPELLCMNVLGRLRRVRGLACE